MVNIGKMMQQARKMQEQMQKMQEEMAAMEITGEAGGGMVKVLMSGDRVIRRVEIDPSLWEEQDKELIEDLVAAAVNAALKSVEDKLKEQQQGMLSGMPLPPGFSP
ncbi:MAG: YbaB/EbfC family nucleoid-associated protein [Mariprofundaceae bacterium]